MAQAQRKARVTVVGTSHIRRLRTALDSATDKRMEANFGVSQVDISYVCGSGWTLDSVCARQATITDSRPDFILFKAGSNDLAQVGLVDSISRWQISSSNSLDLSVYPLVPELRLSAN